MRQRTLRYMLLLLLGSGLLWSCEKEDTWTAQDQRFIEMYTDILVIREQYADTAEANPRVRKVLSDNGHSMDSFRGEFERMTRNAERFKRSIDSAKAYAARIVNAEKEQHRDSSATQKQDERDSAAHAKGAAHTGKK